MAESHRNEIARLEALFSAHPEGRMFTHLAEAYRKAGELDRAREVLEHGLRRHPDYASAHVVLGRVLSDQGKVEEAVSAFRRVLELDPQNLVALRASADLAREAGQTDEALGYYREILALDPTNEEVAELIRGLEAAGSGGDGGEVELAGQVGPAEQGGEAAEPVEDAGSPELELGAWWSGEAGEAGQVETGELPWQGEAVAGAAGEPQFAEAGFLPTDLDPATTRPEGFEGSESGLADLAFEEGTDFGPLDLVGFDEGSVEPAEPPGLAFGDAVEGGVSLEGADVGFGPVSRAEDAPVPGPHGRSEEWLLDDAGEDLGAELVTETMGDLYARQGLHDRAAEVYRELLRARPGDERLASKLAEAEARAQAEAAAGEPGGAVVVEPFGEDEPFASSEPEPWAVAAAGDAAAGAFDLTSAGSAAGEHPLLEIEAAWTGADGALEVEHTPYAWTEEAGGGEQGSGAGFEPSIGEYFRTLLAWRPGGGGGVAVESPPSVAAVSAEPFVPDQPSVAPAAVAEVGDEIDQLFGAEPEASAESKAEEVEPRRQAPGGEDDDDDLEMFRAWLQSLKR